MKAGHALVTGAGARLGRAMAIALGAAGWAVAVHYNSSSAGADETVETIRKAGGTAVSLQANLSDRAAVQALVPNAAEKLGGRLTLLVNSASTFDEDTLQSHTPENWDYHFDANTRAPIVLAQAFASGFPADRRGLIVNLVDQRVLKLTRDSSPICYPNPRCGPRPAPWPRPWRRISASTVSVPAPL